MTVADRIRKARRLAGITQLQLAEKIGLQRSSVANWESNAGNMPSGDRLARLAKVCKVSYEWLATGRGEVGLDDYHHDVPAVADLLVLEDLLEIRLVKAWRRASSKHKRTLLEFAEMHAPPAQIIKFSLMNSSRQLF